MNERRNSEGRKEKRRLEWTKQGEKRRKRGSIGWGLIKEETKKKKKNERDKMNSETEREGRRKRKLEWTKERMKEKRKKRSNS